jgi:DNA-binding MarR family transcriptional regulator
MMDDKKIDIIIDNILSVKLIFFKALLRQGETKTILSPAIYYVLTALERQGSLSMSNIGKEIYMPKPNVTALIDKLISQNLVERIPDSKDRRIINIKLTKKGLKTKKEIENIFKEQVSFLTDKEINELSNSLTKARNIIAKIQKANTNSILEIKNN